MRRIRLNKNAWTVSIGLLLLLITPPIVEATKSECYNGIITIAVEAPNEVKPEEEIQITFRIYSSCNAHINYIRVELWAMGNYKMETLVKSLTLTRMGVTTRNMTFTLKPAPPYPNLVVCDLWISCREEGGEDQFSHCRSTISWCTSSTYDELKADYNNLNSSYYTLMSNYTELLANYDSLQNSYDNLQASYNSLNSSYDNLQQNFDSFNSTYHNLVSDFNDIQSSYNQLNSTYNAIQDSYDELQADQEVIINELNVTRNLMYILMATAMILTATTVYFAKRKPIS